MADFFAFLIAGKTSILCHLANVVEANRAVVKRFGTSPTVGVKMVEFRRRNVRWLAWDMSGQGGGAGWRYRGLWASHASRVHGVIFVVDVTDRARIAIARDELHGVLESRAFQQGNTPVAILANKHDHHGMNKRSRDSGKPPALPSGFLTLENVRIALGVDAMQLEPMGRHANRPPAFFLQPFYTFAWAEARAGLALAHDHDPKPGAPAPADHSNIKWKRKYSLVAPSLATLAPRRTRARAR
eukprot:jgi/Undpi1/5010/HiC_scaffold_19.g08362.m1